MAGTSKRGGVSLYGNFEFNPQGLNQMARAIEQRFGQIDRRQTTWSRQMEKNARTNERATNAIRRQTGAYRGLAVSMDKVARIGGKLLKFGGIAYVFYKVSQAIRVFKDAIVSTIHYLAEFDNRIKVAFGQQSSTQQEFDYATQLAQRLGIDVKATRQSYAKTGVPAGIAGFAKGEYREIFEAIAEASRVFNLSAERVSLAFLAIEQMISKGKVSYEELRRQLGEQLPGALQIAAKAMGVTGREFDEMLRTGNLMTKDFLPKFAAEIRRTVGEQLPRAIQRGTAEMARMNNEFRLWKEAMTNEDTEASLGALATQIGRLTRNFRGLAEWIAKATNALSNFGAGVLDGLNNSIEGTGVWDMDPSRLPGERALAQERLSGLQARRARMEGLPGNTEYEQRVLADLDRQIALLNDRIRSLDFRMDPGFAPHHPSHPRPLAPAKPLDSYSSKELKEMEGRMMLSKDAEKAIREAGEWEETRRKEIHQQMVEQVQRYEEYIEKWKAAAEKEEQERQKYIDGFRSSGRAFVDVLLSLDQGTDAALAAINKFLDTLLNKLVYDPAGDMFAEMFATGIGALGRRGTGEFGVAKSLTGGPDYNGPLPIPRPNVQQNFYGYSPSQAEAIAGQTMRR